jgi:hypothetical protein
MGIKQQLKGELSEVRHGLRKLGRDVKAKLGRHEDVASLEYGERPKGLWLKFWFLLVGHPDFIDHEDWSKLGKPRCALVLLVYPLVVWADL